MQSDYAREVAQRQASMDREAAQRQAALEREVEIAAAKALAQKQSEDAEYAEFRRKLAREADIAVIPALVVRVLTSEKQVAKMETHLIALENRIVELSDPFRWIKRVFRGMRQMSTTGTAMEIPYYAV